MGSPLEVSVRFPAIPWKLVLAVVNISNLSGPGSDESLGIALQPFLYPHLKGPGTSASMVDGS